MARRCGGGQFAPPRETDMIRRLLVLVVLGTLATIAGCGTLAGFGKDVQAIGGGARMEGTARR